MSKSPSTIPQANMSILHTQAIDYCVQISVSLENHRLNIIMRPSGLLFSNIFLSPREFPSQQQLGVYFNFISSGNKRNIIQTKQIVDLKLGIKITFKKASIWRYWSIRGREVCRNMWCKKLWDHFTLSIWWMTDELHKKYVQIWTRTKLPWLTQMIKILHQSITWNGVFIHNFKMYK